MRHRGAEARPSRPPASLLHFATRHTEPAMHYPHKISRVKKVRKVGFRARMKTRKGRAILNRKRRVGRKIRVR